MSTCSLVSSWDIIAIALLLNLYLLWRERRS